MWNRLRTPSWVVLIGILGLFPCDVSALAQESMNPERTNAQQNARVRTVDLDVFIRSDKSRSLTAKEYAEKLQRERPGLTVRVHDVLADKSQLRRLYEISKKAGREKPVLPAFATCNQMYFGFLDVEQTGPQIERLWTVDVYTRNTCPKCQTAKRFIRELNTRWPAIRFRIHEVSSDSAARSRWQALCRSEKKLPGLPTFDFAGRVIIGFDGASSTGKSWEDWISRVATTDGTNQRTVPVIPPGMLPTLGMLMMQSEDLEEFALPDEAEADEVGVETIDSSPPESTEVDDTIHLPVFGEISVSQIGLPMFTLAIGLVDGFNPCAMWILVFLLSILVNIKDRRKILLIAGTFVLVSGLAYFAFMAAWLHMFMLVGIAQPIQIALGVLASFIGIINIKDFFAFKKGISFSIPESSKPGLYRRVRTIVQAKYLSVAVSGAVTLAIVVNLVELLCTTGLPAVYTRILTLHELPTWQNYAYLGLYNLAYMFDDTVLLTIAVITLSNRKMQEQEGRWLKLISGVVLLAIGLTMVFRPEWLSFQ